MKLSDTQGSLNCSFLYAEIFYWKILLVSISSSLHFFSNYKSLQICLPVFQKVPPSILLPHCDPSFSIPFIESLCFSINNFALPFPMASLKTNYHSSRSISTLTTFINFFSSPCTQGSHSLPPQHDQFTLSVCLPSPLQQGNLEAERFHYLLNSPRLTASNFYWINEQYIHKLNEMLNCIHSYSTIPNPPITLFSLNFLLVSKHANDSSKLLSTY